jgi:hypothetical protein
MTTYLGQNPVLLHPLVEALEQAVKALVIAGDYIGQAASASFQTTRCIVVFTTKHGEDLSLLRYLVLS